MKRILMAFDGRHFSKGVFEFGKQMNCYQPIMATGLFLPSIDYVELFYSYGGIPAGPVFVQQPLQEDDEVINNNILKFVDLCADNHMKYTVHQDFTKHVVDKVKSETRFSDVLVLSNSSFYANLGDETHDEYIENILRTTECPVMLVADEYKTPNNIIIAYDGSERSVYAIKQFAYLFPEFRDIHTLLVYFDNGREGVPERKAIEEFASLHFNKLSIFKLKINPKKDLESWLSNYGNPLLVTGSYGRSGFSEMFRQSFIAEVLHKHLVPVFIAHK